MVMMIPGQSSAQDIDFDDELSELSETKSSNIDTSVPINGSFDWSKDLSVLENDNKKTQSKNVLKKIKDIKQQCETTRNPPPPAPILFTSTCRFDDCSKAKAVRVCEERGHLYHTEEGKVCWEDLVDTIRADNRASSEKRRLNKERRKASGKLHRQEMLAYCDANQSKLDSNIAPSTFYPSWDYKDERIFELEDTALDKQISATVSALKAEQDDEARKLKNQKAAEQKARQDMREEEHRNYCRSEISAGVCPCGCEECKTSPSNDGSAGSCRK